MNIAERLPGVEYTGLGGLTPASTAAIAASKPGYTRERGAHFLRFRSRIDAELLNHRVITDNRYTAWFSKGEQTEAQLRTFVVQFSVFSNQFLLAQLNKMVNADTLEGMRASKEILANELGVTFNKFPQNRAGPTPRPTELDPDRVGTEGSVQGGVFHFEAGHFEWLWSIAKHLGLRFDQIGHRRHGTPSTLYFCDELIRLYGGENYEISQAASFAVENWAAAGFWKELIDGFKAYNARHGERIPIGFFVWHDRLEAQHARHTQEELEEYYFQTPLDEDAFIRYGNEMLDGVAAFWDGLEAAKRPQTVP
jgi:pyrroloquinoline quinone (PQQ) biosynthesis protein C